MITPPSIRDSWSWSYGSWIYNYQCKSVWQVELDTTLCDKVCQWLTAGWWFSSGTPVSSTNKTERHDIAEILLKVVFNTRTLTLLPQFKADVFPILLIWISPQEDLCISFSLNLLFFIILLRLSYYDLFRSQYILQFNTDWLIV